MAMDKQEQKKAVKKRLPIVKQTKASMYRMLKTNPLLVYENKHKKGDNFMFGEIVIPEACLHVGTKRDTLDRKLAANMPLFNDVVRKKATFDAFNPTIVSTSGNIKHDALDRKLQQGAIPKTYYNQIDNRKHKLLKNNCIKPTNSILKDVKATKNLVNLPTKPILNTESPSLINGFIEPTIDINASTTKEVKVLKNSANLPTKPILNTESPSLINDFIEPTIDINAKEVKVSKNAVNLPTKPILNTESLSIMNDFIKPTINVNASSLKEVKATKKLVKLPKKTILNTKSASIPQNIASKKPNNMGGLKSKSPFIIHSHSSGLLKPVSSKVDTFKKPQHISRPPMQSAKKIRRSLSAEYFSQKKCLKMPKQELGVIRAEITQSMEDLSKDSSCIVESVKKTVTFKSPNAYKRRSILIETPGIGMQFHTSTPAHHVTPSKYDLQTRLNEWLKKRGKCIGTFHHLKCFGVQAIDTIQERVDDENKENLEEDVNLIRSPSYEDLCIDLTPQKRASLDLPLAKDALGDLHKLIIDGYTLSQCEEWLATIRQKYRTIEEEPQYWECRAAIEQSRGNVTSAVECYKTAIIKGAEVNEVDESLDQLLQKFSLLNISVEKASGGEGSGEAHKRAKHINEVMNFFKSSIIQFAVRERKLKTEGAVSTQLIATPVRRSTRHSLSVHRQNTPKLIICNSLQDLDQSVQANLCFQSNSFLN